MCERRMFRNVCVRGIRINDKRVNALLSTYNSRFAPIRADERTKEGSRFFFSLSLSLSFPFFSLDGRKFLDARGPIFEPNLGPLLRPRRIAAIWRTNERRTFTAKVSRAKRRYLSPMQRDNVRCRDADTNGRRLSDVQGYIEILFRT